MIELKWSNLKAYSLLMRLDKPVGIYLLLWPTVWALLLASDGYPPWDVSLIFFLGVLIMRSAGCVINDFADRKVDGSVERTLNRPLVTGQVSSTEALQLFFLLILSAFIIVLFLNWQTILLSFVAVFLASLYPFMKRYTHLPQVFLGAAFAWSIPMAFMAIQQGLPNWMWLVYAATLTWTVAYDTQYAMVDRNDDVQIGIKSTAILFGPYDVFAIAILQTMTLILLVLLGLSLQLNLFYYIALCGVLFAFAKQIYQIRHRQREACFKAFLQNHVVGMMIAAGIAAHYWSP